MRLPRSYLTGYEARDVALSAGLHLSSATDRLGQKPTLHPHSVQVFDGGVFLDLTRLSWWERWRVLWTRVGMHQWVRQADHIAEVQMGA